MTTPNDRWDIVSMQTLGRRTHLIDADTDGGRALCGFTPLNFLDGGPVWENDTRMTHHRHDAPYSSVEQAVRDSIKGQRCLRV